MVNSDPNDDWGWEIELDRAPEWMEQLIAENDIKVVDCKTIKGGNSNHRMLLSDLAI